MTPVMTILEDLLHIFLLLTGVLASKQVIFQDFSSWIY